MDVLSAIRSAPRVLEVGDSPAAAHRLDPSLLAVKGDVPGTVVERFEGDDLAVIPLDSARDVDPGRIGPVYRDRAGGLTVPTGRVLVSFGEDDEARAHARAFASVGFELLEVLRYAPHAAWVQPLGAGPAEALARLERLRSLPGVTRVEPQLLMPSEPR